jgi:hypothetical protein
MISIIEKTKDMTAEQIMDSLSEHELRNLYLLILNSYEYENYSYTGPAVSFVMYSPLKTCAFPNGSYTAIDNRAHECNAERFPSKELALAWATDPEGKML